ncbi:MAG: hypothetical protein HY791_07750 [Deltaproteobacteria bacterium]|nr:hypothetical protein [Deltaproteobacteria bacterium]
MPTVEAPREGAGRDAKISSTRRRLSSDHKSSNEVPPPAVTPTVPSPVNAISPVEYSKSKITALP